MFYWIALVIGVLLLLGVFSRNKPGEKSFSLKERIGFGVFALVLVLVGFDGIRPKPPAPVAPATTPALTQQPELVQTAPEPATTTQDEAGLPSAPTLPNLAWVDITLNLEKWPYGFKFNLNRISKITNERERCASKIDPDTAADMRVCVYSAGDAVTFVEAMVTGSGANNTASWLIPYVATVPYEGRPDDAKSWAEEALKRVRFGKPVERRVKDVTFLLTGNPPTAYTLRIYPVARDKWLNNVLAKQK